MRKTRSKSRTPKRAKSRSATPRSRSRARASSNGSREDWDSGTRVARGASRKRTGGQESTFEERNFIPRSRRKTSQGRGESYSARHET